MVTRFPPRKKKKVRILSLRSKDFCVSSELNDTPSKKGRKKIPFARIDLVERLYLRGASTRTIELACAREYGVSARQARHYLYLVHKRVKERAETLQEDVPSIVARSEALLLEASEIARSKKDASALVRVARTLAELRGALGPQRVELSGANGKPLQTETVSRIVYLPELEPDSVGTQPGPTNALPGE